jgi:NADH-quinone oxidoreductase subunit J
MVDQVIFYFFAGLAVVSSALVVTRRNAVHSAIFLITALLATAGIYLQLRAEFLFAVQVILYVGGIMVVFVFVIMLVNLDVTVRQIQFNRQRWVAGLVALVLAALLALALQRGTQAFELPAAQRGLLEPNTERVGEVLFQKYLLPFEIASILLLVALIGAVVMAKKRI